MRIARKTTIRQALGLLALSACALLGGVATASAATPTLANDPASAVTDTAATLNATLATDSTLTDCHFQYVDPYPLGGDTSFTDPSVKSVPCASSDGVPIAAPGDVPADSASHAVSATVALAPGTTAYYRLLATNADGPSGATTDDGWQATGFGLTAFDGLITDAAGDVSTQAAAHPATFTTSFDFTTFPDPGIYGPFGPPAGLPMPVEDSRDVSVELPPGFLGATAGLPQCTATELANGTGATAVEPLCPSASQIGLLTIRTALGANNPIAIYNMVPPPGIPARFGINAAGTLIVLDTTAPAANGYRLRTASAAIPQGLAINGNTLTFWGVPSDPAHDSQRNCRGEKYPPEAPSCNSRGEVIGAEGTDPSPPEHVAPFFRNPTSCTAPGRFEIRTDSWQHPGDFVETSLAAHQTPGYPEAPAKRGSEVGTEGCEAVPFEPTIETAITTNKADSPTGLTVDLDLPRECWDPKATVAEVEAAICQSDMKEAAVTLPAGLTLNPAAAGGRGACTPAQAGLTSPLGAPAQFDDAPVSCPDAAKLGTVEVATPLLDDPLGGSVYLAQQTQNPFGSLLAMYLVIEGQGIRIKQAGEISLDPKTGRVTTRFGGVPQQPFSNIHLSLYGGPGAALRTPPACGTYTTQATLTPWSGNGAVNAQSSFQITECPNSGFDPKLKAGTQNPLAGSYSPFTLRLTREDGTQEIAGLSASLAPGLIGRPAGIAYCSEATLAAISGEPGTGASQIATPSCPAAAQIGTATVGAGAGPEPFYTQAARVYLAAPYKGAPLSIAVVAPAVAGPFDLGTVVVRNALRIDPESAQITAVSDPLPQILHGIPLDLREIRVDLNRPDFTLNPTSCEPQRIATSLTSAQGATANPSVPFQAAGCDRLGFKPKLTLAFKGALHRRAHPALSATYTTRAGDANLARAQVKLPPAAFLDNAHIGTICTRVQFAAQACPAGSIYGHAEATSPILGYPVQGPVYLRSSTHKLPDLVADLRGPSTQPIEVALAGKTDSVNGALRNTFELVPDAPVTRFHLSLFGGKRGLIEMSSGFCAQPRASVSLDAQNGRALDTNPTVRAKCGKSGKGAKK